jgi:hypothetical protein
VLFGRLRESVGRKKPKLWPDKWILCHGSAPAHDALRVREFLAKKSITKMDHPPYSLDLAPCDFWLFPKLKNALKGQRFADIPDIQRNMTTLLWVFRKAIFRTVFGSGTIVSRSAELHKESVSRATAAASEQISKFCFHRAIPGIQLLHLVYSVSVYMVLWFCWFVVRSCPECFCLGRSLLYESQLSWLFVVGVSVMSVVLIPRMQSVFVCYLVFV